MRGPRLHKSIAFVAVAAIVLVLDRLGKRAAVSELEVGARIPLVGELLSFARIETTEVALGLFRDWGERGPHVAFAVLSIFCVLLVLLFYRGLARGEHGSAAALGAILAGVLSNAWDRYESGVGLAFLHLGAPDAAHLPDFSLAELAILLGVVTLIVELLAHEMAARVQERPPRTR